MSSSVDQTACRTPAAFVARAIAAACFNSRSVEKCSQKFVTRKAPWAPAKARSRLAGSSASPATTSAPAAASARALSEAVLRVIARAANRCSGSARMARTSPPPWAPVAPMTAMVFLSDMCRFPSRNLRLVRADETPGRHRLSGVVSR